MPLETTINAVAAAVKDQLLGAEAGHDWNHIERVYQNAAAIYESEKKGQWEVVQLAVLLHDIADAKFHGGDEQIGLSRAKSIMEAHAIPETIIQHVLLIIENMSYRHSFDGSAFHSAELDIVRDADRLDAIGAVGIARAFHYGGFKNSKLYDRSVPPNLVQTKKQYVKGGGPTINHFYEKLLRIKGLMVTAKGWEMARERHAFLCRFIQNFNAEAGIDFLPDTMIDE